jgi:metal-dependent amidase/aminoacylase/carboxypeptidase family protein
MKLTHSIPLLALSSALAAQSPLPTTNAKVRAALDIIKADNAWTLQQQVELTQIPSPPFKESARAAEFKKRLEALGLSNVRMDSVGDVIAERRGSGTGPTVLVEGHLDTVFPEGTVVTVKHAGDTLKAPGIGDDDRGLATVLAVARAFEKAGLQTNGTIYFVGNVGEEGPGNLRGTRNLLTRELKGKIDYFITVDDAGLGIASRAVGSNRYKVTYKGPGGHSYGAFGIPNPIHALGRAIAGISDIQVPTTPKTTFNVGIISGGTSVNSIPFDGRRHALRERGVAHRCECEGAARAHACARRGEQALARTARRKGEADDDDRYDRHSADGRSVRRRADRAHRIECRQGTRLHVGNWSVEHGREHSDQHGNPRHPHGRRWHQRWSALAR